VIRVGSLCSGYGGLDLGLELALGPVEHAWHVEYDKHPSAILAHHWPDVPNYGDVKHTDWTQVAPVDWLTAGYPCQPFSHAGLRKGADDPRHLWPAVAHAIGVLRPGSVLLENVAAHLRDGFDTVLADLARLGYDASWGVVRASDAGAPHGRARLFVVAHADDRGPRARRARENRRSQPVQLVRDEPVPDSYGTRLEGFSAEQGVQGASQPTDRGLGRWGRYEPAIRRWERVTGHRAPEPTDARLRLSAPFVEWMMGLSPGWVTDVPGIPRNGQIKALGNGVVPQQAALALRLLLAGDLLGAAA
jgi:DNA (cytosine-5)-methyltransferase 1